MSILKKIGIFSIGLISFFWSVFLLSNYTEGDYVDYSGAYEAMYEKPYMQSYLIYGGLIGSSEPIPFTISWIAANIGFDRISFVSLFNSLTVIAFLALGRKIKGSLVVLSVITLSNLYFLALFTELERLKFGFLFFFISIYFYERKRLFFVLSLIAILSHLQFLIMYGGLLLVYFKDQFKDLALHFRIKKNLVSITLLAVCLLVLMSDALVAKFIYYRNEFPGFNYLHLLKLLPFVVLSYYYAQNKGDVLICFLPLFIMIALVGGNRLIIFAYFIFLYFAFQRRSGLNLGVLATTVYFAITGAYFIFNIFESGRGYGM